MADQSSRAYVDVASAAAIATHLRLANCALAMAFAIAHTLQFSLGRKHLLLLTPRTFQVLCIMPPTGWKFLEGMGYLPPDVHEAELARVL